MGLLHLVTGRAGAEHVTGADHGAFHAALLVADNYVLNTGNKFSASVVTNNSIKILDGELIVQGRHVRLKPGLYEEVTIENGAQDYKRNDLIVVRYTKNENTGIENTSFVVIKGTPSATTATDPAYTRADILGGALVCDMPLYRVPIDGLNVGELVPLFETIDSFDERIKALVNGTTKAGNAEKLDGHDSDYFATAESVSNIQTTSRATLSQAGWYRVAEITDLSTVQKCDLKILRAHWNNPAEIHTLGYEFADGTSKGIIAKGSRATSSGQAFTKARVTKDTTKTYFEVYYAFSVSNTCQFTAIDGGYNNPAHWKAITPTLTSETVDGVTVTTTYDIPANASPVTDLDIKNPKAWNNAHPVIHLGLISNLDTLDGLATMDMVYTCVDANTNYWILGYHRVYGGGYGVQMRLDYFAKAARMRTMQEGVWRDWNVGATTADLANYFKNTGGTVNGHITVEASDASSRAFIAKNSLREINLQVTGDGKAILRDSTNNKNIIDSTADGKTTVNADVNGTASGNLPLSGGEAKNFTIGHNSFIGTGGFKVKSNSGTLGYIGMDGNGEIIKTDSAGSNAKTILHTGNSAKVVVSETPLTAEGSVRVW